MSGRTSFPDVTLAEQRPLTSPAPEEEVPPPDHPASNHAHNNSSNATTTTTTAAITTKDTVVILSGPQHGGGGARRGGGGGGGGGVFVTRAQLVFFLVCVFLVLTIFVLLAAFVTRELCLKEHHPPGAGEEGEGGGWAGNQSAGGAGGGSALTGNDDNSDAPPLFPDHPFSGLRLPRALVPSHYDLELRVNLRTFLFSGSCNITLTVNTSTRYVVFHRSDLALNESLVSVRSRANLHRWTVVKQYHVTDSQFHILELDRHLPAGLTLRVEVGKFAGFIRDDLRGLYQSSYKTADGKVQ